MSGLRPAAAASGRRPNILLLLTDEHGAQFSGTYGHPFIATPAMDRLAAEGVTFDAAYCNNPLCVPSRLSFITGQYTHRCRGWDNATPLPPDAVTWPHLLRAQGYDVALSGKMHLIGEDPLHGFQEQLARDLHIELQHPIFPWDDGIPEASEPWPGVVRTDSRVPPGPDGVEAEAAGGGEDFDSPPTGPGRTPEIDADDDATAAAVAYLRSRAHGRTGRPFALCVGLIAPHFPVCRAGAVLFAVLPAPRRPTGPSGRTPGRTAAGGAAVAPGVRFLGPQRRGGGAGRGRPTTVW